MATVVDYWVHAGDIAELTFHNGETMRGIYTIPPGGTPGWVLSDGCRIGTRPRTLERITIVYPPEHAADHTLEHTTEDEDHD
jgi:hypothetical protein